MPLIDVIHGPNLNMLGIREPEKYGKQQLVDINASLQLQANQNQCTLTTFQSNAEHLLIERIHGHFQKIDFMIINPGAYTHTSIALRDALLAVNIPFIEVHLSNIYTREPFRHKSYLSDIAVGVITGLGSQGYSLALIAALNYLPSSPGLTGGTRDS